MKPTRKKGKVSVIIPSFNNAQYIGEAVHSVASQSYNNVEIIVVNDGSTDNTDQAIAPFRDSIVYIKQKNQGASAARNRGIKEANGEWVAFLDSDDRWNSNKLETQMTDLGQTPKARAHSVNLSIQRNSLESDDFFQSIGFANTQATRFVLDRPFADILKYRFAWLQTTLIHHTIFDEVGLLETKYPIYEDFDFLLRTAEKSSWTINRMPLVEILRREEGPNLSSIRTEKAFQSHSHMLEIHLNAQKRGYAERANEKTALTHSIGNCYSALLKYSFLHQKRREGIAALFSTEGLRHPLLFLKSAIWLTGSFLRSK